MYTLSLLHSIQGLTQTTAQYDRYAHTYNPSLMHKCIIDTHGRRHEHAHTGALCCLHMQKLIVSGWFCFVIMRSLSLPPLSCLNGDTVQLCLGLQMTEGVCVCACASMCAISIPSLGRPQKRLYWNSPAVDVIVLWLFPYLGRFNILFHCLACQQLGPSYLPFAVIQECSGLFKLKQACVSTSSLVKHWAC